MPSSTLALAAISIGALAHLAAAQSSTSSTNASPTTPFSSDPATAAMSTDAWVIPLVGPTATVGAWGVNVTQQNNNSPSLAAVALALNRTSNSSNTAVAVDAIAPAGSLNQELLVPASSDLLLGKNTSLTVQSQGSSINIPTVPFTLTLGLEGSWNGSLIFGGYFDVNRIFGESWEATPIILGETTFLSTGRQVVGPVDIRRFEYKGDPRDHRVEPISPENPFFNSTADDAAIGHQAFVDFTAEQITLPSPDYCGQNISLTFNRNNIRNRIFYVPIASELTSGSRCTSDSSGNVILGKPFFQAAMLHVDKDGIIYFIAANQWNLPVKLAAFSELASFTVPSAPASATPSFATTSTRSSATAVRATPWTLAVALGLVLVLLIAR